MPNINLKNFAKIKDSDFDIKDITVFAGKPGSGKSYVMKTLYAIYEAPNKVEDEAQSLTTQLDIIKDKYGKISDINSKKLTAKDVKELKKILKKVENLDIIKVKNNDYFNNAYKNILTSIFGNINQISNNFIITYDNVILDYSKDKLDIKIINNDKKVIKNAIFVETPLILEFKKFMNREEGKTPYHIESLLKILDKDYSFTDEEQDEFIKSFVEKSKNIINGSIEDSGDSFVYKTDKQDFDIINASSGIKSIGLLQYLVTNKALKKGSILFWEEPEVHLHPTWQLKMVDLFVELMDAGVKVIFSTHSPFMTDYLNAKSKKENFRNKVSFNLLNEENGIVKNTILDDDSWDKLQSELLDPLEEVMWEYI